MRKLFDQYQAKQPRRQGRDRDRRRHQRAAAPVPVTVLNAKDPAIDIYLIDIVNPAQYFGAGWLEPLDAYIGKPADVMKPYLPVYASSNVVDGKVAAMPAFADAMFMYYRKDLLDKHKHQAEPKTWDELSAAATKVQKAEGNPNLQGLSIQGAPIEGAVCTFLLPYWGQGKEFNDAAGKMTLDKGAAARA
jgi:multiple sugar transport system substrate-binding protein